MKVYELKNDKDVDHLCKELKEVIKQTEKPHLAKIEIKRSKRSIDQNSLLWLWLTCLEKDSETGSSKQDFYDHLIMGIGGGTRIIINDLKPNNESSTAFAINIKRNHGIQDVEI